VRRTIGSIADGLLGRWIAAGRMLFELGFGFVEEALHFDRIAC
jgi:hypothetical protein